MTKTSEYYPIDVYLFRHAEGKHQLSPHIMAGRSNHTELTGRGIRQALQLGRVLKAADVFPTRVYASPAKRTVDTGKWALHAMGLRDTPIKIQDELQELSHGPWEGKPRDKAYTTEVLGQIPLLGLDFRLNGGESMNDVMARSRVWRHREIPEPTPAQERYFIFTHGLYMKCAVGDLLDWGQQQIFLSSIENTHAVHLCGYGDEWDVMGFDKNAAEL